MSEHASLWKNVTSVGFAWLTLVALYLLMVGQLSAEEIVVGLLCASLIMFLFLWSKSLGMVRFRVQWRLIAPVRWLPGAIVRETALVLLALGRRLVGKQVCGATLKVPFKHMGDDPQSASWRAAAVFGVSVSPNSYISYLDKERQEIHVRQLVGRTITRGDKEFLGLQ